MTLDYHALFMSRKSKLTSNKFIHDALNTTINQLMFTQAANKCWCTSYDQRCCSQQVLANPTGRGLPVNSDGLPPIPVRQQRHGCSRRARGFGADAGVGKRLHADVGPSSDPI